MTDMDIYIKLVTLPDEIKKEVDDFVDFLKSNLPQRCCQIEPEWQGWRRV